MLEEIGWIDSRLSKSPIDADGRPLPWYTYPAIALLDARVRSEMRVFEFGCGFSTLWWASRVSHVTSIDHTEEWVERIGARMPSNVSLSYVPLEPDGDYCRSAQGSNEGPYDVIVIDGRDRVNCALNSIEALTPDGVIVWDNSDRRRYAGGKRFLARNGFNELPLQGFGPFVPRVWDTSVFYRPENALGL
jgi:hypothetical protein